MQEKNSTKRTHNRRLAIFCNDYQLRPGLTISAEEEFVIGRGHNEFSMDEEDNLVLFVGEFTPHRVNPKNFHVVDEITVTTVKTYRRKIER